MDKLKFFLRRPANQFVIKVLLAYAGWKLLYYFFTQGPAPVTKAWESFTYSYGVFCARLASPIVKALGEPNFTSGIHLLFDKPNGRWDMGVAEHCLAIPAMVIFSATILSFPGLLKNKLWFIPLGLFLIFVINIARLVFLCIVFLHCTHATFTFFHTYVYVVITYSLIFLMVVLWVKKYASRASTANLG